MRDQLQTTKDLVVAPVPVLVQEMLPATMLQLRIQQKTGLEAEAIRHLLDPRVHQGVEKKTIDKIEESWVRRNDD